MEAQDLMGAMVVPILEVEAVIRVGALLEVPHRLLEVPRPMEDKWIPGKLPFLLFYIMQETK